MRWFQFFTNEYLRSPKCNDVARLLEVGESRGFPWMLSSIDERYVVRS
jgi:hypothetical protein